MNLVISGPIDDALRNAVIGLGKPRAIELLHARAYRLEDVDASPPTRAVVADLCAMARVDHAYVASDARFANFGLLVIDMDSTLITIECIDEMADFAGKKKEVAAITEAAMRGEISDFAESLRRRVALLAGTDADVMRQVFEERLCLSPGACELIDASKSAGAYTLLISGGFTYFTDRLVKRLSFNAGFANSLEIVGGKLTGRVVEPILDSGEKARIVQDAMIVNHQSASTAIVIGDGSNDIPMMKLVTNSVAYHAKPAVTKSATHSIKYGSLTAAIDFFG